jgi:hypothetical protein
VRATLIRIELPKDLMHFLRTAGAKGWKIGGKRAVESMTPEQRTARAKKAAAKFAEVRSAKKQNRSSGNGPQVDE